MCFSAGVSFGAGALLAGAGIVAIKKIESPNMLAFACLPVLFGIQQVSEGILWRTFHNPGLASWHTTFTYLFIFFSHVLWPIWIPFAVWLMDPNNARKKMIFYCLLIGGALSVYIIYCMFTYEVSVKIENLHIRYQLHFPNLVLRRIFYFLAIGAPFFISSVKWMKLLGAALLGSMVLTYIFYFYFIISVWCFFAAVLSVLVLFIIATNKKPVDKGRPDYYITPTRDFTQFTKDSEEKYWSKETKFNWDQNIPNNLKEHLENLPPEDFLKVMIMVLPMVEKTVEFKIVQIRKKALPLEQDALKDIAECIPFNRPAIHQALLIQSPLKVLQLSLSKLKDQLEILNSSLLDLNEQQRLGLYKDGIKVKHVETEAERQEQGMELSRLTSRIDQVQEEYKQLKAQFKIGSEQLKTKIRGELHTIEHQVLIDLEETKKLLQVTLHSKNIPAHPKDLAQLKDLILKRQLRGLKDIANHSLVVEQSAIAPLTMGIIHYKRHREIQEAMTTFVNDEAKHSATFRRFLVEKLEAKEFISATLLKGASRYMWLARLMPGVGMFLAVIVEAIGAAYLEFFGKEEYMPDRLYSAICQTITEQDEKRHLDLCVGIYNELYRKGTRWERYRNKIALKVMMKAVYGDKTEDHHLIQAFRAFGVESEIMYQHILRRLSQQLARISVYVDPEKLLEIIGRK